MFFISRFASDPGPDSRRGTRGPLVAGMGLPRGVNVLRLRVGGAVCVRPLFTRHQEKLQLHRHAGNLPLILKSLSQTPSPVRCRISGKCSTASTTPLPSQPGSSTTRWGPQLCSPCHVLRVFSVMCSWAIFVWGQKVPLFIVFETVKSDVWKHKFR